MPVTESVSSFKGFYDVYPSCRQLTHKLARLFDKCEFVTGRHTISFKEATKRLRTAVENSLSDVENNTSKKVVEFKIGKVSVTSQANQTFDPMEPMTWGEVGGINGKWREHKNDNYDGLIAVGCVTNELIPNVIKEMNTVIPVDHQMYALGMAQALVHHYMLQEPDGRLRNKSFDIGEGERGDEGGIIYIAYKLESEDILLEMSSLGITGEEPEGVAITAVLDDNDSPFKQARATQEDQTFGISTSSPEKIPEKASVSKVESEEGPKEKGTSYKIIAKEEKILILNSYISLTNKSNKDELVDIVYEKRHDVLSGEMIKHYEELYKQKLKYRIRDYIQRVQSGKVNETDQEIIDLMKVVRSN